MGDARRPPFGTATAGEALEGRKDHVPAFDGTDQVGFTALPAGAAFRGSFGRQGHWAVFWTSTENGRERAVSATLDRLWHPAPPRYRSVVFDELYLKENGFSVRCLSGDPALGDPPPDAISEIWFRRASGQAGRTALTGAFPRANDEPFQKRTTRCGARRPGTHATSCA